MPLKDCNNHVENIAKAIKSVPGQTVSLKKRQIYSFHLGKDENIWLVESGHIMIMRGDENGNLKGFSIMGAGDVFGISICGGTNRDVSVFSLNTAKMYCIPSSAFENLLKKDHSLCHNMFFYACSRLSSLLDDFEQVSLGTLEERLAALNKKIQNLSNIGEPFKVSETIAAWAVGAHPVSVCRALKGRRIVFQHSQKSTSEK
jgi:CRP-like cAMP-binding protein